MIEPTQTTTFTKIIGGKQFAVTYTVLPPACDTHGRVFVTTTQQVDGGKTYLTGQGGIFRTQAEADAFMEATIAERQASGWERVDEAAADEATARTGQVRIPGGLLRALQERDVFSAPEFKDRFVIRLVGRSAIVEGNVADLVELGDHIWELAWLVRARVVPAYEIGYGERKLFEFANRFPRHRRNSSRAVG